MLAGAPEDIVLTGGIAQAFEGRQIRFYPETRNFRLLGGHRGAARVRGSGLPAAMARAVLEREGYVADAAVSQACAVSVEAHESGWRASTEDGECAGADFASLAAFLRGRGAAA